MCIDLGIMNLSLWQVIRHSQQNSTIYSVRSSANQYTVHTECKSVHSTHRVQMQFLLNVKKNFKIPVNTVLFSTRADPWDLFTALDLKINYGY